jgi:hypothetical protein
MNDHDKDIAKFIQATDEVDQFTSQNSEILSMFFFSMDRYESKPRELLIKISILLLLSVVNLFEKLKKILKLNQQASLKALNQPKA